jgi:hypothetical protein
MILRKQADQLQNANTFPGQKAINFHSWPFLRSHPENFETNDKNTKTYFERFVCKQSINYQGDDNFFSSF